VSLARDLVEFVGRALADHPDAIRVTETGRRDVRHIALVTRPGDLGKLIGRQGRTAAAVRTLAELAGEMEGSRVTVDFLDEAGRE